MPPAAILSSVEPHHVQRVRLALAMPDAQQHLQVDGPRKFRRTSKTAVPWVERGGQTRPGQIKHIARHRDRFRRGEGG